jgi:hypothetical protein
MRRAIKKRLVGSFGMREFAAESAKGKGNLQSTTIAKEITWRMGEKELMGKTI